MSKVTHLVNSRVESQMLAGGSSREMLEDVLSDIALLPNWIF